MQPLGEPLLDWVGGDESEIVLPSFEDGIWREVEGRVLSLTASAWCIENGSILNTICWDMTSVRIITTKIFVVIQKWQFKLF